MKARARYALNKAAGVGTDLTCPACGSLFTKKRKDQAFCRNRPGTECKDTYWNTVTPTKRNNVTRISPANAAYKERMEIERRYDDDTHPFDIEGNDWMGCKD
jgi:hypothetical protein